MSSFSFTETRTFSITHARHMAAKVAADLMRMRRLYDSPSEKWINDYEIEVIELLKAGYLGTVHYGFQRNGKWVEPTLKYKAKDLLFDVDSDDPGRVTASADISGAVFNSYLTYSSAWNELSVEERNAFKDNLPFQRTGADEPGANGFFLEDKTYSAGGKALNRASLKSY